MNSVKMNDEQMDKIVGGSIVPYQVQQGDTLNALAQKFNVSVEQLMKWNNIKDPNTIFVGQQIKVKY